jgi:hypothetical protein
VAVLFSTVAQIMSKVREELIKAMHEYGAISRSIRRHMDVVVASEPTTRDEKILKELQIKMIDVEMGMRRFTQ